MRRCSVTHLIFILIQFEQFTVISNLTNEINPILNRIAIFESVAEVGSNQKQITRGNPGGTRDARGANREPREGVSTAGTAFKQQLR